MTGRLKRYSSTGNILSKNKNLKNSAQIKNINTKRTINPSISLNLNDEQIKAGKKIHNLSNIYNKSSTCLNPEYFNPLINYKNEDKKEKSKIRRNYISNKDHFNNMIPTQLYSYTPHTKKSKFNFYQISQIDNIPGSNYSREVKNPIKKTGKKIFKKISNQETKNVFSRNNNYLNNYPGKFTKVYEFDNPAISHIDMNSKYNKQNN